MIDLGNELNGYDEGDENHEVSMGFTPTVFIDNRTERLHSIGRLADLQKGGFNTVAPPTYRAYRAIGVIKNMVDLITREHDT